MRAQEKERQQAPHSEGNRPGLHVVIVSCVSLDAGALGPEREPPHRPTL